MEFDNQDKENVKLSFSIAMNLSSLADSENWVEKSDEFSDDYPKYSNDDYKDYVNPGNMDFASNGESNTRIEKSFNSNDYLDKQKRKRKMETTKVIETTTTMKQTTTTRFNIF